MARDFKENAEKMEISWCLLRLSFIRLKRKNKPRKAKHGEM